MHLVERVSMKNAKANRARYARTGANYAEEQDQETSHRFGSASLLTANWSLAMNVSYAVCTLAGSGDLA